MTGVPRELTGALGGAPHQHMGNFGTLPQSRERRRAPRGGGKGKQTATGTAPLEPINERPQHLHQIKQDAATSSTTDLAGQLGAGTGQGLGGQGQGGQDGGDAPKTGKAQMNPLAKFKMFSAALRR
jgi:hypothetical protein